MLFLTMVVKTFSDRSFEVNVIELVITTETEGMIFKIRSFFFALLLNGLVNIWKRTMLLSSKKKNMCKFYIN